MTIFQMLNQSGILAVLGMGVVFSFLILLVVSVSLSGNIIRALGASKKKNLQSEEAPSPVTGESGGLTAAIAAAVNEYRKKNTQ